MPDTIGDTLLPDGPPAASDQAEFFEQYKIMVASSETLVSRRQGVNAFFLTVNGLLGTVLGLLLHQFSPGRLEAGGVAIITVVGFVLCYSWQSLIKSFGQLNTGKFAVINRMERHLAASIFNAEWKALGEGKDRGRYKTFTSSELTVPRMLMTAYAIAALFFIALSATGWRP